MFIENGRKTAQTNPNQSNLKVNFSYGHFLSQAFNGYHQLGASFNRNTNTHYSQIDQNNNLNSIPQFLRNFFEYNDDFLIDKFRVSVRSSTKDRIPFYSELSTITGQKLDCHEYVLGGMGAWGFVYAPYYAEILVKELVNEIQKNSNLKNIINKKNNEEKVEFIDELLQDMKLMNQLKKIEYLERKVANNLDENSYSELIRLKNQLNSD